MKRIKKYVTMIIAMSLICVSFITKEFVGKKMDYSDPYLAFTDTSKISEADPEIQMYFFIKKYAKQFNIPEEYAFSIAYQETRYQGPKDTSYDHSQRSYAGALGPMQIMPGTANGLCDRRVDKDSVRNDINLNVYLSMQLLRELHDRYDNWGKVFAAYNTGKPKINKYAKAVLSKEYVWE
jgi:soluble lytic murein transglycosylase-like protein